MVIQARTSPSSASDAEVRVREIASRIGLYDDSEILDTVCHKMREEYVVELWQLPALDSRQWDKLQAPIGLAVAVQRLSSSAASSLARSTSSASLLRLLHERDQQQQLGSRSPTSSIFRSKKKKDDSSEVEGGTSDTATDDSMVENETVAALLAVPSELPPLFLSPSSGSYLDEQKDEEDVTMESRLDLNDSNHSNRLWLSGVVRDGCETPVMDERAQEGKEKESEYEESCLPNSERGEQPAIGSLYTDSRSASSIGDMLEICLADSDAWGVQVKCDSKGDPGTSQVHDQGEETVNVSVTASPIANSDPEMQVKSDSTEDLDMSRVKDHEAESIDFNLTASPAANSDSEVQVNSDSDEDLDMSRVKDQEEERIDFSLTASPTTTAITLVPTPEKLSRGVKSDSMVHVDKNMISRSQNPSSVLALPKDETSLESSCSTSVAKRLHMTSSSDEEREARTLDLLRTDAVNESQPLDGPVLLTQSFAGSTDDDDDNTVVVSNVSPEGHAVAASRNTRSELDRPPSLEEMAETSSYEGELVELQEILKQLPVEDHSEILSQLMIMSNARGQGSRIRLAYQVKDALLTSMENHDLQGQTEKATHLVYHLAKLTKPSRQLFGKSIFKAMSKLYTKTEKKKGQTQHLERKRSRRSVQPPLTIAFPNEDGVEEEDADSPTQRSMEIATTTEPGDTTFTFTTFEMR